MSVVGRGSRFFVSTFGKPGALHYAAKWGSVAGSVQIAGASTIRDHSNPDRANGRSGQCNGHPSAGRSPPPWAPEQPQSSKIPAQIDCGSDVSVAVGGIGAGAITRGVNGGFTRWSLKAGALHIHEW